MPASPRGTKLWAAPGHVALPWHAWRRGGVATQRPAKPCTPVRFRSAPLASVMRMPELIAVTGATGGMGGRVARRLAALGAAQRLVVRDPSRAPDLPGADVRQIAGYHDAEGIR